MKYELKAKHAVIVLTSSFLLATTMISPNLAHANSTGMGEAISDYSGTLDEQNINYSYELNGEFYKVEEEFTSDFKGVTSRIYKKDKQGEYQLDSKKVTSLDANNKLEIETETIKNNQKTIETFDIQKVDENDQNASINLDTIIESRNDVSIQSGNLTSWQYSTTQKYSSKAKKFTVGALTIIITAAIPWTQAKVALQIANLAYQMNAENVYFSIKVYYKYLTGTKLPRAEKNIAYVYADSKRTKLIGGPITKITYS